MNQRLIFELKAEHAQIRTFFDEIDGTTDLATKQTLVRGLQTLMTVHTAKEDQELYPVLQRSDYPEVQSLGEVFLHSMLGYSADFLAVTQQILTGVDTLDPGVGREYERVRDQIKNRMFVEEVALFPAYEKIA